MTRAFDRRVRAAPHVLVKALRDEAVLLDLESEQYFGLDPVAARMWELLNSASSVEEAYEALAREYEVDPLVLQRDLERIVDELLGHRLLVVEDG